MPLANPINRAAQVAVVCLICCTIAACHKATPPTEEHPPHAASSSGGTSSGSGTSPSADARSHGSQSAEASVEVEIQTPGDSPRTAVIDGLSADSTVGDVMQRLQSQAAFSDIQIVGSGERMMLSAIGPHATQAGQGWLYEINGNWAKQGIGTQRITPGDRIVWKYGKY